MAKVAAAHFSYDESWILSWLSTRKKPTVAAVKPEGVELTVWNARTLKVTAWCAAVMSGRLWWDGAGSKTHAIGDRVYQEAYEGRFNSYLLAARTQGIHGYQFRAPAEWFAELYAAYYCDKLKPSHPFVPELLKLAAAEKLER